MYAISPARRTVSLALRGGGDQCIVVRAPARTDLYVRPDGYDYARYAGFTDAD